MKKKLFAVVLACMMILSAVPVFAQPTGNTTQNTVVLPEGVNWTEGSTVYYNGEYFDTLNGALKAVFMSDPGEKTAEVYCKPDADVGEMTHAHVADDIIIYGNNAKVTGGEHDLEVDTYKYSRETGEQNPNGQFLTKNIKILVKDLNGIAVWGQRNTGHKVDVVFESCENINRMYVSGTSGEINYNVTDCTFDASKGSHSNTSIYTNAPGTITLNEVSFKGIGIAINQNNKSKGTQTINVNNCVFEDCSGKDLVTKLNALSYAAPIRIVAQNGAKSVLNINNTEFKYSEGFEKTPNNGDVLIGDGRQGEPANGICELNAENNRPFRISLQKANFYDGAGNVANPLNARNIDVNADDVVITDDEGNIIVDDHSKIVVNGKKDATCQEEGYTGDTVCAVCGKEIKKGEIIPNLAHNYKDGKCTVCGEKQPATEKPETPETPQTGDENNMVYLAMMIAFASITAVALRRKYNK